MQTILKGLSIKAISCVVPKNIIPITDFYSRFGENEVKRIGLSTGIKQLRVAPVTMNTSDMCLAAAENIFNSVAIDRGEIDAIIFVSQTPDYRMPATSCLLQTRLNLSKNAIAFDINYGCSGYLYGLYQAALLVSSENCRNVLLCAGDTITRHLDPHDQKTQLVLGDAASATLITKGDEEWAFTLMTDGSGFQHLIIDKAADGRDQYLRMDGAAIMEFALREVPPAIYAVLQQKNWQKNEVDQFVLHQANAFILNYLRKKLDISNDKFPMAVEEYGNTGPASIPLTLCHLANEKEFSGNKKIVFAGFGVGLSWGAVALSLENTKLIGVTEI